MIGAFICSLGRESGFLAAPNIATLECKIMPKGHPSYTTPLTRVSRLRNLGCVEPIGPNVNAVDNSQGIETMITEAIRLELQRIETKIDTKLDIILQFLTGRLETAPPRTDTPTSGEIALLRSMTPRQHIVAQLLVMGWLNRDISELMEIGENTVKLHVRAVCKKADVKTRGQAAMIYKSIMDRVHPDEYLMLSGGLPVGWAISLKPNEPDPYRPLYEPRKGGND